ncbi:helix-turn-helix transcriptional regulator [Pseudotenacibaculum sp. MALMAid0570]|uniref:helix-turn-helix domain-containing protein n=1 Tax=Pseudotenacibaculum sp. MALMAid0570 TaxID=3143938 RepID=UPI0032E03CEC
MKQPELGKRILELRKSKGLTQEELVEKCNINVRTIQRIEAGDVTPRSFTVKTILEVLGVDSNLFFGPSIHEEPQIVLSQSDKTTLQISWISGIFLMIFSVIGMIVEYMLISGNHDFDTELIPTLSWNVPFLIALFFFLRGYHKIGKLVQNSTLVLASYIYFVLEIIITILMVFTSFSSFSNYAEMSITVVAISMLFGISELVLGIGIMKLKEQLGSYPQVIGIIKIVLGVLLISVVFAPLAGFLVVPILIFEVVFIYNTLQEFNK